MGGYGMKGFYNVLEADDTVYVLQMRLKNP